MLLIGEELKRELSESKLATSQLHQTIEHGCGITKARYQILINLMKDLFEMIDHCHHAENPLDHQAIIALAMLAKLLVERLVPACAKPKSFRTVICSVHLSPTSRKCWSCVLAVVHPPVDDLSVQRNQPAELNPDDPAMLALAFLADLGGTRLLRTDGSTQCRTYQSHSLAAV